MLIWGGLIHQDKNRRLKTPNKDPPHRRTVWLDLATENRSWIYCQLGCSPNKKHWSNLLSFTNGNVFLTLKPRVSWFLKAGYFEKFIPSVSWSRRRISRQIIVKTSQNYRLTTPRHIFRWLRSCRPVAGGVSPLRQDCYEKSVLGDASDLLHRKAKPNIRCSDCLSIWVPWSSPTLTRMKQRSISKYIMDQVWASIALGEKQVKFNGYGIRFTNHIWKLGI